MAKGYDGKGNLMPYLTMKDVQSSGGLKSSTNDMLAYIRFQLNEANKTVQLTHQKTVKDRQGTIGLNWHIDRTSTGGHEIWHTGGTLGFTSYVVFYPEQKLGIVLLANESDPSTQSQLIQITNKIVSGLSAR
ncbi:serine hydrolase [Telluribacter humicola]|uniref:serine hydrolase n=1 Tax=Telluribacter humicola TaxID=1720261 RepID=UPI0021D43F1C|nr:serine hydrolase domain-containing protein [Telluribacter humicola]